MARHFDYMALDYRKTISNKITVNGVETTMAEFKTAHAPKQKKRVTTLQKKRVTTFTIIKAEISGIMNDAKILKSLLAYRNHGYRQWGTIATDIMSLKEIKSPFLQVAIKTREVINLISDINGYCQNRDKDVFSAIEKLSWCLEDANNNLELLADGISKSGVLQHYKGHECIFGKDKRLGLQTLMHRANKAMQNIACIVAKLNDYALNGFDISEYTLNGKIA